MPPTDGEGRMKRGLLVAGVVLVVGMGQAEAGVFSAIGQGVIWSWNLIPQAVRVVNTGVHFVCDTLCGHPADGHRGVCGAVHGGVHTVADVLTIQQLP